MAQLGRHTQGKDRKRLRAVNDFSHIPGPSEAEWVGEWHFFEGCCPEHREWRRFFGGRSWTVECFGDPVQVEIAGSQFSDGSTDMWICVDGDIPGLDADEAVKLAATLSSAASELERVQGGSL
jgi:hypothetical protein